MMRAKWCKSFPGNRAVGDMALRQVAHSGKLLRVLDLSLAAARWTLWIGLYGSDPAGSGNIYDWQDN